MSGNIPGIHSALALYGIEDLSLLKQGDMDKE